jgi:hypothetical protein
MAALGAQERAKVSKRRGIKHVARDTAEELKRNVMTPEGSLGARKPEGCLRIIRGCRQHLVKGNGGL